MDEATICDDGYNRKKNRKRKKKQQNNTDKSAKRRSKGKKNIPSKLNPAIEIVNSSGGAVKSREIMNQNLIAASVPCLVLTNINGKNPEILGQLKGSYDNNVDITIESVVNDDGDHSDVQEAADDPDHSEKPIKQKRKHVKHSEYKKHKQKHSYKGKHRSNTSSLLGMEPLDISDLDVQRKLTSMPSLKASNMKDMSVSQNKANTLPGNIICVGNEFSMTTTGNKTATNITNCGKISTASHLTERDIDKAIEKYNEGVSKLAKEHDLSDSYEFGSFDEMTCGLSSLKTKPSNGGSKPSVSTILSQIKPPRNSARKSIIKASKLAPAMMKSSEAKRAQLPLTADLNKSKEEIDISTAADGLLVLQQNSWEAVQKCSKSNVMFPNMSGTKSSDLPPVLMPQTSLPLSKPQSMKFVTSPPFSYSITPITREPKKAGLQLKTEKDSTNSRSCSLLESNKSPTPSLDLAKQSIQLSAAKPAKSGQRGSKIMQTSNGAKLFVSGKTTYGIDSQGQQPPILQNQSIIQSAVNCTSRNPPVLSCSETLIGKSPVNSSFGATVSPPLSTLKCNKGTLTSPTTGGSGLFEFKTFLEHNQTASNNQNSILLKLITNSPDSSKSYLPKEQGEQSSSNFVDESCETSIKNMLQSYNSSSRNQQNVIAIQEDIELVTNERCMQYLFDKIDSDLERCESNDSKLNPSFGDQSQSEIDARNNSRLSMLSSSVESTYSPSKCPSKAGKFSLATKIQKETLKKGNVDKDKKQGCQVKSLDTSKPLSINADEQYLGTNVSSHLIGNLSPKMVPVIPGHITDMLYPSVPDVDLLQAFNDYWSTQISHCAICAAFASTTSGTGNAMTSDWKYCKPTNLPESSPIWVDLFFFFFQCFH